MTLIIDRFEGDFAVCENENRKIINIEISKVPGEAREGDILKVDGNKITLDYAATKKRKAYIKKMCDDIWN